MSLFADECREQAARYAERAAGFRMAGAKDLTARAHTVCNLLALAAHEMELLGRMETGAAERLQA